MENLNINGEILEKYTDWFMLIVITIIFILLLLREIKKKIVWKNIVRIVFTIKKMDFWIKSAGKIITKSFSSNFKRKL